MMRISLGELVEYSLLPKDYVIRLIVEDDNTDDIINWGGEDLSSPNKMIILIRMQRGTIVEYSGLPDGYFLHLIDEDVGTDEILDWGGERVYMS